MMKITPAAAEPMMRGSFSSMLELYSSTSQETNQEMLGTFLNTDLIHGWISF